MRFFYPILSACRDQFVLARLSNVSPLKPRRQVGFTLLEMLMVIALLAATAGIGLATFGDEDGSARDLDSSRKLALIEKAIVGQRTAAYGGEMRLSGFVVDMGRLPNTMDELLGVGTPAYATISDVQYDPTPDATSGIADNSAPVPTGLAFSAGLRKQLQTGASSKFLDGWGNAFVPTLSLPTMAWLSKGRDAAAGGTDDQTLTIAATDWQVDLSSWKVTVKNADAGGHVAVSIVLISQEADTAIRWRQRASATQDFFALTSSLDFQLSIPAAHAAQAPIGRHVLLVLEGATIKAKRYVDFYPGTLPAPVTLEIGA